MIDILEYFKIGKKPQYKAFMKACEKQGGKITETGSCLITDENTKTEIRDWRDNSIDRPSHDLKSLFARNDYYFFCYAKNTNIQTPLNLNDVDTDNLFNMILDDWQKAKENDLSFPDWLVDKRDWKVSLSNYGWTIAARKKNCNPDEEIKMTQLANSVFLGNMKATDAIMEAILHLKEKH